MRTTQHRAKTPNPTPSPPLLEVRTDDFVFLCDDMPVIDMVELHPGVWGMKPVEYSHA